MICRRFISRRSGSGCCYGSLFPFSVGIHERDYDNGIKISGFLIGGKNLGFSESDRIDALDKIRMVHESGISIKYNIVENGELVLNYY